MSEVPLDATPPSLPSWDVATFLNATTASMYMSAPSLSRSLSLALALSLSLSRSISLARSLSLSRSLPLSLPQRLCHSVFSGCLGRHTFGGAIEF